MRFEKKIRNVRVEVLIPDFQGNIQALETVVKAGPDVLNHNIETVPRLYSAVRPQAKYQQSLDLLKNVRSINAAMPTKSGLMLGLGETDDEIQNVLNELAEAGCRILTLGQYLQPTEHHLPVQKYIRPEKFEQWRKKALSMGFFEVSAGPFVRSSYHAKEVFQAAVLSR
jgi:lipoic acid synthetase